MSRASRISTILLACVFLLSIRIPVHAAVVINEILPKTADTAKSWIELYNSGSEPVSLDRWTLENITAPTTFMMNASNIIAAHGFLTLPQTQTGITFSPEGDSLKLYDDKRTLMDQQGYPGILGYNTSMGRSVDGGGVWTMCTPPATYNKANVCPPPPDTPTPTATLMPTYTPIPTVPAAAVIIPTEAVAPSGFAALITQAPAVLGTITSPTPTPTKSPAQLFSDLQQTREYRNIWLAILIIGMILLTVYMYIVVRQNRKNKL